MPILMQIIPVYALPIDFLKIHYSIILLSTLRSSVWSAVKSPRHTSLCNSPFPHTCHCPTHFFILYFRVNAMYCTANMYENAFELYQIHMFFRQYLLTLFLDYLTTLFEVQKLPCRILCMRLCLCVTNKYGVGNVTVLAYGTASNYSGFT